VTGVQAGKVRPIDDVRKELLLMLAQDKGRRRFAESAEVFINLVFEQADSLKPAAEQLKLTPRTTGWVTKTPSEALGPLNHPKVLEALFSAETIKSKRNTDAIEVAPGTLVSARVIEHQESKQRSFVEAKAEIEQKLRRREAAALAAKEGEAKLEQLRGGGDAGLKWTAPVRVTRRDAGELTAELQRKVMSADPLSLPAYAGGLRGEDGYVLVRVAKVIKPEAKSEVLQAAEFARIARQIGATQYDAYIEGLRARADITINQDALENRPQ
jgi:peptidyl-prolyl cis-trans isomerase D